MNTKKKGSKNERKSIALLKAIGYNCMKAGASLGAFDVIGISSRDIVLVQCKSNRWPLPTEVEAMQLFPAPSNAKKLIHRWDDRKRTPQVREL